MSASPFQSATVLSALATSSRFAAVTAVLLNGGAAAVVAETVTPPTLVVMWALFAYASTAVDTVLKARDRPIEIATPAVLPAPTDRAAAPATVWIRAAFEAS